MVWYTCGGGCRRYAVEVAGAADCMQAAEEGVVVPGRSLVKEVWSNRKGSTLAGAADEGLGHGVRGGRDLQRRRLHGGHGWGRRRRVRHGRV